MWYSVPWQSGVWCIVYVFFLLYLESCWFCLEEKNHQSVEEPKMENSHMNRFTIQIPCTKDTTFPKKKKKASVFTFQSSATEKMPSASQKGQRTHTRTHTRPKGRNVSFSESRDLWQHLPEEEDSQRGNNRQGWTICQGEPLIFHK